MLTVVPSGPTVISHVSILPGHVNQFAFVSATGVRFDFRRYNAKVVLDNTPDEIAVQGQVTGSCWQDAHGNSRPSVAASKLVITFVQASSDASGDLLSQSIASQ